MLFEKDFVEQGADRAAENNETGIAFFLNSSNEIDWLLEINDTISNRIDEYNALVFSAFKTIKRCTNEESARKMIDSLNAIDGINFNRETGQLSQQSHKNYRNLTSVSS